MPQLLSIKNLIVTAGNKTILRDISLDIRTGETHVIMGPNGSGKSTLAHVIVGDTQFEIVSGDIDYKGESILGMPVEQRARRGIFLAFQHPVELPGVTMLHYLRLMYEARHGLVSERKPGSWQKELKDRIVKKNDHSIASLNAFNDKVKKTADRVGLDTALLERPVNEGFSGGEKKKSELLQMALLEPGLILLDEIDSGLDIDAIKSLNNTIRGVTSAQTSFIVITHHEGILSNLTPTKVYVFRNGEITRSGDWTLTKTIKEFGYEKV